jgi:hypothetical protein
VTAPLFVDTFEIRMAQEARGAGEACCFLWRHGELGPSFCVATHQYGTSHHAVAVRAAEGFDCGSERHSKSYSRKPGLTETRFRPLARRREITFLPPWVFMRVRKPCFLLRLRRLGWNVRLGMKDSCS